MGRPIRQDLLSLLIAAAAVACGGGDPVGPGAVGLSVAVVGLPTGIPAQVTVTGPGGYSQSLTGSQTLSPLSAGSYTVTALNVTVGSTSYSGDPISQTVNVGGSANALVTYSTSSAGGSRLLVNINGLASGTPAALTVTGPGGYSKAVTTTQTLIGLASGTYTVTAQNIVVGGTPYTASPSSQSAAVTTAAAATATATYGPPPGGAFNLRVDGMYLTQSAQTYEGVVPLVQSRDGFLRVFVTANQVNAARPAVRIRFYQDFVLQSEQTVTTAGLTVPTAPNESSLSYSWNLPVSGALIRPGLSIIAEVDIANAVVESNEMDNAFPTAAPRAMNVRAVPPLNVMFVPVIQRGNGYRGDVSNANAGAFLDITKRMHPLGTYNAVVHAPYTTTTSDTLEDNNGNMAWGTILGELDALRVVEKSSWYYYGVAKVSYGSGVAGVAYVSGAGPERAALGWDDLPTGSEVVAHELGHNWGRNHAPCGTTDPDPQYPNPDGSIGVYGLDVATQTLKPSTLGDVMGYCDPKWIGDYTYKAVMNYLSPPSPIALNASESGAVQPSLLVWGHIRDGEMVLEPAFQVNTRPKLPQRPGPYSVEATSADGSTVFNFSFAPAQVADAPGNQQNFVFAVPLSSASIARVSKLRLSGRGRQAISSASVAEASPNAQFSAGARPDSVDVRRVADGRMRLRWNARAHPMVMVRDAATGEVLSLARGGDVQITASKGAVDLVLSDGVKSRVRRVSVNP